MSRAGTRGLLAATLLAALWTPSTADASTQSGAWLHVGWLVTTTVYRPWSDTVIEIQVDEDAGSAHDKQPGDFTIAVRTSPSTTWSLDGMRMELPLEVATDAVVTVNSSDGTHYSEPLTITPGTRTVMRVTKKWAHAGHEGMFVNHSGQCSRNSKRARPLRFAVRVPGHRLQVGNEVVVAPGNAEAGPRLPDGRYTVWVQKRNRGRWRTARRKTLKVRGGAYRFEVGCNLRVAHAGPR